MVAARLWERSAGAAVARHCVEHTVALAGDLGDAFGRPVYPTLGYVTHPAQVGPLYHCPPAGAERWLRYGPRSVGSWHA